MQSLRAARLTPLIRPATQAVRFQGTNPTTGAGGVSHGPRGEKAQSSTSPTFGEVKEKPKGKKPVEHQQDTREFKVQDKPQTDPKSGPNAEEAKQKANDTWESVKDRVRKPSETEHSF